jgi:hypothetical protein
MTKSKCYLNFGLILLVGAILTIVTSIIYNSINSGFWFHVGGFIVIISPALVILLVGLILQWFKKPKWKTIFIVAWVLFLVINIVAISGNLLLIKQ